MRNQEDSELTFKDFVEQTLAGSEPKSIVRYSLESFLGSIDEQGADAVTPSVLKQWIAAELIAGKKPSTVRRFFMKVHALFGRWKPEGEPDCFDEVAPVFASLREQNPAEPARNLEIASRMAVRKAASVVTDVFFYLLYLPKATLVDVVTLTFDNAPQGCPQIDDIIDSAERARGRKYVFPLSQGKSRPSETERNLTAQLHAMLTSAGMEFAGGFSRLSLTAIWIAAAIRAGVTLPEIRACISIVPPEFSALSLIERQDISVERRRSVICRVADRVNSSAKRWFVMKLRRGATAIRVKERTEELLPGRLSTMDFFYPTRTEIRKEGRRRVAEEIPYLPDMLFFKTQPGKVKSLFAAIGDLAWGYKAGNTPDAGYSMIPNREMLVFQRSVAQFTPDMRIYLADPAGDLEPGRRVRITGGIMEGYEGQIIDVATDSGHRIFSLALASNLHARWEAQVDDTLIQPL